MTSLNFMKTNKLRLKEHHCIQANFTHQLLATPILKILPSTPVIPKTWLNIIYITVNTSPPAPPKDKQHLTQPLPTKPNEKLTNLNATPTPEQGESGPCSSSPGGSFTDTKSIGVEEDYNSEPNYSLSLPGSRSSSNYSTSSRCGSDNETSYGSKQSQEKVDPAHTQHPSDGISGTKIKFMENINLCLLGATSRSALLMMTSESEKPFEEPIYDEFDDLAEKVVQINSQVTEEVNQSEDPARSRIPLNADALAPKRMVNEASPNEILSFSENIRDLLTGTVSTSSESQSSSMICSTVKDPKKVEVFLPHESILKGDDDKMGILEEEEMEQLSLHEDKRKSEILGNPDIESRKLLCPDCNDNIDDEVEENNNVVDDLSGSLFSLEKTSEKKCCRSCNRKRNERKEIIMEIYETELKYGRDLKIISEEFYKPIQGAGLLTKEQLDQIFLNLDDLIQVSWELTGRLKQEIQRSLQRKQSLRGGSSDRKDDELSRVNVGKIFLELGQSMMSAFENYCNRQASAGALLSQLEKEKKLLRMFLRDSQMENTLLRRMNLPAFLMAPVQRVTRYPLLLSRLLKVTPIDHFARDEIQSARDEIQSAKEKIEQHLEHMNKTTRQLASVKLLRRVSIIYSNNSVPVHRWANGNLDASNIRIRKIAMKVLNWTAFSDVHCVLDNLLGRVHLNRKLIRNAYGCLLVRGKDLNSLATRIQDQDQFFPPARKDAVKEVKLVLVRVKNTRFCLVREPLCLSKCVVSQGENEFSEFIEIYEIVTKNTYFIQGLDRQSTSTWLRFVQCYSSCAGHWRRRRPALTNIMMKGMITHL